jgi:hypothetical protein
MLIRFICSLMQHFNDNTFRDEEELYVIEGVKYKKINFSDSQPTLDLIEKSPGGILPLLDDEGMFCTRGSGVALLDLLINQYSITQPFPAWDWFVHYSFIHSSSSNLHQARHIPILPYLTLYLIQSCDLVSSTLPSLSLFPFDYA